MTSKEIAERIEQELVLLGKPKKWFYEQSGVSRAAFSLWKNENAFPTKETLDRISRAIGVRFIVVEETEKPAPLDGDGLDELDKKLIDFIPRLSSDQKVMLLAMIETALKAQEGAKEF